MDKDNLEWDTLLEYLAVLVNGRLRAFFEGRGAEAIGLPERPAIPAGNPLYAYFNALQADPDEYAILLIALAPHLDPNFFDRIIQQHLPQGGDFPEIGGVKGTNSRGMLPTGETAQFILAGTDLQKRMEIRRLLQDRSRMPGERILWLETVREGEPEMSGRIILSREWLHRILTGSDEPLDYGPDFPAKRVTTEMNWDDLVLDEFTIHQIEDIKIWMEFNKSIYADEGLRRKLRPGYRVLFHGPPGTGKTLTATLLGKQFQKEVYRIDLSQIVSKYIGETEKNLEKIFSRAETRDWILFFDEADALFGKRTQVQNSHDRYANQEVSYLLQRVEDYPGLLILASNFKNNIDDAFLRRFHISVHFPFPGAAERLDLWKKTMPGLLKQEPAIHLAALSEKYELTGAAILNIVHYATLKALSQGDDHIRLRDLLDGIKREYWKEDKAFSK